MGQLYYRNQDDQHMSPELIAARYAIGASIYFEVQLTLAEYADMNYSAVSPPSGSPELITAFSLEDPNFEPQGGCPEINQYVWVGEETPRAMLAKSLRTRVGEVKLYSPVTRNFNLLIACEILEGVPLFEVTTVRGVKSLVSQSHKIIKNTADLMGVPLFNYLAGGEILSFDEGKYGKKKNWNIYADTLLEIKDAGIGDVVKISLENEFIYATGMTKTEGTVAHNRKVILQYEPYQS